MALDRIWIVLITLLVALIIAMLFEDSRDWLSETFGYIITFEWFSDIGEFFGSMFEGIGEFSIYGIVFGVATVAMLFFLSKWTLQPFLQYYSPSGKILWGTITYIGTFISGYLLGKVFENSG